MTSFTETFGGSAVSPADVAYAAYSFSTNLTLYWPQFSAGQTNVAARFMNLTATAGSLNVSMPDATLNSVGYDAIIFNAGSDTFNIVDFEGGSIATIPSGQTYYIILNNNATQAGGWQTVQFGVGTGSANAAALAGFGLIAVAGLLDVNLAASIVNSNFSITTASTAVPYVWNGGSGTITLPTAASVGNGFFFALANNGSGSVTVTTTGGNTIDGNATSVFSQTQSGFILSDGANWITIGKGIQNTFAVTLLNLNVSGASNITETAAQAQNIIQIFTGVLTGNISVIVPNTVQLYFCSNQTTGSFTLEVKTATGMGIVVPQGTQNILYCDGTNVDNAYTATVSGTFALANGTAAAPSLNFQNSTSTGLFSPGTGLMSVTANGTEVMRFGSNASAVNYFGAVASQTGTALALGAIGTDTNINITVVPKGTGFVSCGFLDATVIGANSAAAITGTTITASSFFVGNLTGNVTGNVSGSSGSTTGNAATASALNPGNTINGVSFTGSAPITVPAAAGTLTGTTLAANIVTSSLTSVGTLISLAVSGTATLGLAPMVSAFSSAGVVLNNSGGLLSSSTSLPNGTTATTQAVNDASAKVATTTFANPSASLTANGHVQLPSGVVINWGNATASSSASGTATVVNMDKNFGSTIVYAAAVPTFAASGNSDFNWLSGNTSSATFSRANSGNVDTGITFSWIAIGY